MTFVLFFGTAFQKKKSSGTERSSKAKVMTEDPAATLISYLHSNGIFQTALRLFKLAEEIRFRSTRVPASELPAGLFDTALETLGTKVLGSKTIDHSLAFAYMVALPMQKSFVAFKVCVLHDAYRVAKKKTNCQSLSFTHLRMACLRLVTTSTAWFNSLESE